MLIERKNCILNGIQADAEHFIVTIYNIYIPGRGGTGEDERGWEVAGGDGASPRQGGRGARLRGLRRLPRGSVSGMWRKSGREQHVARQCQAPVYTV